MFRRLVATGLVVVCAGVVTIADAARQTASAEQLVAIATETVDLGGGSVTIDLSKVPGAYRGIRLRAKRGDAEISRVQIRYSDGSIHNEDRNIRLRSGERTREIDARDSDRFIDQVTITTAKRSGKVTLEVMAVQSPAGVRMARPATSKPPVSSTPSSSQIATRPTTAEPTSAPAGKLLAGGEVLFGAQDVGFGVDRDVIRVGKEIGKFDRIRLRVLDNDIFINDLTVLYAGGEKDTLAVNANIAKNSKTEWLNLKGNRFIDEVQLVYRSRPNFEGQARVEVFGDYAPGWLGAGGEGRKYNGGWVLLGSQTAGSFGFDKDVVSVGGNEGGFRQVRVTVRDRDITLSALRVMYENGDTDNIPTRGVKVVAGSTYGPVDLKSRKAIKEIQGEWRSRRLFTSARKATYATVEVWGLH